MKKQTKRVYLDYAASTPVDTRVAKVMVGAASASWANASSLHVEGESAKAKLEEARVNVAAVLHCKKSEVFFTSGGTEGCNMAILGVVRNFGEVGNALPHIITSTIEHRAILEPIKNLVKEGRAEVSFVSPDREGLINPDSIKKEIKENTVLVCLSHANNEIGTIQSIRKIFSVIKTHNTKYLFHTPYLLVDASQSACYEDISIERMGADILVLDGTKIYGPRGAGILVIKNGVAINPIMFGGGQEQGLRSGTENVVAAVGLAEALKICAKEREKESERLKKIRDYTIAKILKEIPNSSLNGSVECRLPNNINICLGSPFDSEFLVIKLDTLGFAVSAASACSNLSLESSSYVIEALGKPECASSSLRFTLGHQTKKQDLDKLIATLKKIIV